MILETDESFALFSAAVVQQFEGKRPFFLAEFAGLKHFCPFWSPQVIFQYIFSILSVYYSTFIYHNFSLVPFTERFCVLWNCRNHIIQRSRLSVIVFSQFCIRMVGIIQYLILRSRDIDRLYDFISILIF